MPVKMQTSRMKTITRLSGSEEDCAVFLGPVNLFVVPLAAFCWRPSVAACPTLSLVDEERAAMILEYAAKLQSSRGWG